MRHSTAQHGKESRDSQESSSGVCPLSAQQGFLRIPFAAMQELGAASHTFAALLFYASCGDSKTCWASQASIARQSGLSRSATQRQLNALKAAGVIAGKQGRTVAYKLTGKGRRLADGRWARLPRRWKHFIKPTGKQNRRAWRDVAILAACTGLPKKGWTREEWYDLRRVSRVTGIRADKLRERLSKGGLPAKLVTRLVNLGKIPQVDATSTPSRRSDSPEWTLSVPQVEAQTISSNYLSERERELEEKRIKNATATAPPSAEGCGASGGSREGGTKGANSDQRLTGTDTVAFLQAKAKAESQAKEVPA